MARTTVDIHGYRDIEQIHDGVKSLVFRAIRDIDDSRAILKIRKQVSDDAIRDHPLLSEAGVLKSISSAHVPRFLEIADAGGPPVLVYEDIGGDPLSEISRRKSLTLSDRLTISIKLCSALHDIHDSGLVHGDINPSNVIWNPDGQRLVIVDFARVLSMAYLKDHPDLDAVFEGALTYVAPEQTGRVKRSIDYRTDLYSFGATLYELFTHKPPFIADSDLELIHAQIAKIPRSPAEIENFVPEVVSDIIMKLLEKSPDDRYQTALGVANDLNRCVVSLKDPGHCEKFELGLRDRPLKLSFADKLYGRTVEMDMLKSIYAHVSRGATKLALLSGSSGIGKTTLADAFSKHVNDSGGIFVSGKFDQLKGDVPYSAFKSVLRNIVRYIAAVDEAESQAWREKIETTMGRSAGVLIDFLPELKYIMDDPGTMIELDPAESQDRFNEALKRFIRMFANRHTPLVIFLDDVQWIDPGTIRLLRVLISDWDMKSLLVLCAYRNDEIDDIHPLKQGISYFRHNGISVEQIPLDALNHYDITMLLADTFGVSANKTSELAKITHQKTHGNPFFVRELISNLYERGLIVFDPDTYEWVWTQAHIEEAGITENVVDLLSQRIGSLNEDTFNVLAAAACIGSRFNLELLARITDRSEAEVSSALAPALHQQFIVRAKRLLDATGSSTENIAESSSRFAFSDDRIQYALYSALPPERKQKLHLTIGRTFLSRAEHWDGGFSFDAVDHLNRAAQNVRGLPNVDLAALNLEAGVQARKAAAYPAAKQYLNRAKAIVATTKAAYERSFLFRLSRECAHVAHMNSDFDESRSYIEEALQHTDSDIDKAELLNLTVVQQTMQGSYHEAIDCGRTALQPLGISLPAEGYSRALELELRSAERIDAVRDEERILAMPLMTDSKVLAAMKILTSLYPPSHSVLPDLNNWIAVKMVNLSLQYGFAPQTAKGFVNYGSLLALLGDHKGGFAFGHLALRMIEARNADELKPQTMYAFLGDLSHWIQPLSTTRALVDDAYLTCREHGELPYAGYTLTFARCMNEIFLDGHLKSFSEKVQEAIEFVISTKNTHAKSVALAAQMAINNLLGKTDDYNSFQSDLVSETEFMRESEARDDYAAICFLRILQAQNLYLYGHHKEALAAIRSAQRLVSFLSTGMPLAMLNFFSSMIHAASCSDQSGSHVEKYLEEIERNQELMKKWSEDCPSNFLYCYYLVEGEVARIHGRGIDAVNFYTRAAEAAARNDFKQFAGLAHELAGRMWLESGNIDYARRDITRAYRHYLQWGATRKLELMASEYTDLLTATGEDGFGLMDRAPPASPDGVLKPTALDLNAVSAALHGIRTESSVDALLDMLVTSTIEVAGADKYILFLYDHKSNTLEIKSRHDLRAENMRAPVESDNLAPMSLIQYAFRTQETITIEDARSDAEYRNDPYIVDKQPRSLLCLPIIYQGLILGVLYLENHTTPGAFSVERLETLEILSTLAAILLCIEERDHVIQKLNQIQRLPPHMASASNISFLQSRRREVAILFCDLRGFTAFCERVEPEEHGSMLAEYHDIKPLIDKYNAVLDHRAGDGMMIFFENSPMDAASKCNVREPVMFAIELRAAVNKLLMKWERYGHSLGFGIGISCGYATIGMIGYDGNYNYTATGRYVNLASRLCDEAKHDQILIPQRINSEIEDSIDTEFVADLDIKGFHSKISTYNVK